MTTIKRSNNYQTKCLNTGKPLIVVYRLKLDGKFSEVEVEHFLDGKSSFSVIYYGDNLNHANSVFDRYTQGL